ncbi:MAG: DUF1232 domain-containing protein [Paramuribaculum sp.]|nr:DUF1232 domain-containing protein [Paramuribaculum sp.]
MAKLELTNAQLADYKSLFNPDELWKKIGTVARKAGAKAVYMILLLYYTATDPRIPLKDKALIYGSLGYFILPIDAIPDTLPLLGLSDDMAAITAVVRTVGKNINDTHRAKARVKLEEWFGAVADSELIIA